MPTNFRKRLLALLFASSVLPEQSAIQKEYPGTALAPVSLHDSPNLTDICHNSGVQFADLRYSCFMSNQSERKTAGVIDTDGTEQ
jgi:hypothetical protein